VVAEAWYFNTIFLSCLKDGKVIINLIRFVVYEDLDLLAGEEGPATPHLPQEGKLG
jgi:hypothetical protein